MKRTFTIVALMVCSFCAAMAQEKPAAEAQQPKQERSLSYYKIDYVVRELQDGKTINSRNYVMTIEDHDRGEAKIGAKVPIKGGGAQPQYMDVGLNISCRVVGRDDFAALHTTIEISSFALPEQTTDAGGQPVLRQMRSEMAAVVPLGKPTVIGDIDDVNSTKRYEVAVTATKLK